MARTDAIRALRRIVEIRAAQEAAARMQLGRLAVRQRQLDDEGAAIDDRMARERTSWSAAVSATPLDLPLAGAWSAAVHDSKAALRQLDEQSIANQTGIRRSRTDLQIAQARADLARDLARSEARRNGRRTEEAALNEMVDRFAQRVNSREPRP